MALLDKTTLQKSAGLLNATAPEDHFLAYITEGERNMLVQAGGKETLTKSGIKAYPPLGQEGTSPGTRSDYSPGQGHRDTAGGPPSISAGSAAQASTYTGIPEGGKLGEGSTRESSTGETKDNLITKVKNNIISKTEALDIAGKLGWVTDNAFIDAIGGAWGIAMGIGGKAQSKAINWDLNRRLNKTFKEVEKGTHPGALGYKISDLQDKMERSQLDPSDPRHYGQDEYSRDYPSRNLGGENADDRGDARGLTNIITPYAAHAIGGTTQEPSMAAQWYSNLGGNQGGFDLTTAYASAKAKVSQTLGQPTAIGQLAVNESPFFNFLKENSLNKGIL